MLQHKPLMSQEQGYMHQLIQKVYVHKHQQCQSKNKLVQIRVSQSGQLQLFFRLRNISYSAGAPIELLSATSPDSHC